ncbi:MAG: NADP-specific glutamate dehydrogenase [Halobacteriovoraceae bacterium]|nr:NADP-specific glutamate dehydrogenase [Halobacteriovoraceae bacterium]|tara:strand:- start:4878 stop:6209 length:1332 start_codon:yes stop_codon:yes gene_type:complete
MSSIALIDDLLSHHHSYQNEFKEAVNEIYKDILEYDNKRSKDEITKFFERLIEPDRTIRFKVEWFDDKDRVQVNRGYRIQFNNSLGPYKGGLRFHPTVNESILKFLGFEQIFKNALTGIPMGGAKGGADFDPKGKSEAEVRRFCKRYMEELYKYIGANIDIPAGDIGVGVREIGYMYGQYLRLTDNFSGVLTGKHPNFGGSCGREEATGYGCVYFIDEALNHHGMKFEDKRVLVSGSGNVALFAVEKLIEFNTKVLTVSDSDGTLYFEKGISEDDLNDLKVLKFEKRERLRNYTGSKAVYLEGEKPWSREADIAIPCATQNEIDAQDAMNLKDNGILLIAEGANMPLSAEAQSMIENSSIIFLPGKATNAGGVAASGFERSQNAVHIQAELEDVDHRLRDVMKKIHRHCIEGVDKKDGVIPYKIGANLFAFNKIYHATTDLHG